MTHRQRYFGQGIAIRTGLDEGNVCRLVTPVLQVVEYPFTQRKAVTLTVEKQVWSN
jgi:hypothetical protein